MEYNFDPSIFHDAIQRFNVDTAMSTMCFTKNPAFKEAYIENYSRRMDWKVPRYIIRSVLFPIAENVMLRVECRDVKEVVYLSVNSRHQVVRLSMAPGVATINFKPKLSNQIPFWNIYSGQMAVHHKFKSGRCAIVADHHTSLEETTRRFWVALFNAVFDCGWENTGLFPFLIKF